MAWKYKRVPLVWGFFILFICFRADVNFNWKTKTTCQFLGILSTVNRWVSSNWLFGRNIDSVPLHYFQTNTYLFSQCSWGGGKLDLPVVSLPWKAMACLHHRDPGAAEPAWRSAGPQWWSSSCPRPSPAPRPADAHLPWAELALMSAPAGMPYTTPSRSCPVNLTEPPFCCWGL